MSRAQVLQTTDEAVAGIEDGSTVLVGGFGLAGMPFDLIDALIRQGAKDLTIVSNNAGNGDVGLAALLKAGQVRKVLCSFPRQVDSWVFDGLYREGKIELEVVPQGNLAERMRAAGRGHRRVLLPHGGRHAAGGGQGNPRDRRPHLCPGIPDKRRLRPHRGAPGRHARQPRLPQDGAELRPRHGHRRRARRSPRSPRSSRSARWTRRPSSPRDLRRPDRPGRGPSLHRAGSPLMSEPAIEHTASSTPAAARCPRTSSPP